MTRHFDVYYHALRNGHDLGKKKNFEDFLPSIQSLLSVADDLRPGADTIQISFDDQSKLPIAKANGKNIALIPVIGPLTKYGDLCTMGMQDYQSLLSRANASSSIDGIVLIMDTPGGTVDGTPEFGLAIKNSAKPVGIFGDGMVASAGIWLASQAGVIVGNKNNPTEFGSIGVLMALPNYQNMMDAGEVPKVEIFRASQSTEKAQINSIEPITDAGRAQLQAELDDLASQFIATVKAGRGDALKADTEGIFAGRMYDVYKSKSAGLIDSVGTLQTAVNKVAEMAKQKYSGLSSGTGQGTNNANQNNMWKQFLSFLGWSDDKTAGLTEEQAKEASEKEVAALRASLKAAEDSKAALDARILTLEGEKQSLATAKAEADKQIATLTESETKLKAELAKKPTGTLITLIPDASKEAEVNADGKEKTEEGAKKYRTSADDEADKIRKANHDNQLIK
jgi:protease-4